MLCLHGATSGERDQNLTNIQVTERKSQGGERGESDGWSPALDEMVKGGLSVEVTFEVRPKCSEESSQVTMWSKNVLNSQCKCSEIN